MKKLAILFLFISLGFFAQEENYTIKNLEVNTKGQEFGASYYGDSTIVFTSARKEVFMKRVWSGNHQPFLSLYQGTLTAKDEIIEVRHFGGKLDTKFHESNVNFSKDLKTVYFDRNNFNHNKYRTNKEGVNLIQLYKAKIDDDGKWSQVERLPFNSDQFSSGHPILNNDETKLYFISDRPDSFGETDIYEVIINPDGTFGEPKNLGENVNTSKKEMFPFVDENDVLYFSSNGFIDNKGGLDIYVTKKNNQGQFHTPFNLGFPMNSNQDDFSFVKKKGGDTGYFSSNRYGGKGDDDLYSFIELREPYFECPEIIKGIVTNAENDEILSLTAIRLYHNNEELGSMITDIQGRYHFNVQCKTNYKIVASKNNFEELILEVNTENDGLIELDISLTPEKDDNFLKVRDQVMLNIAPIYFDLNEASLKLTSEKELQSVVDIMNKYPEIIIQIRAHTDSRGRAEYNLKLSDKRAKTAMNWIVARGIHKDRVLAAGFGEEQLVNECKNGAQCSEEEHSENRRTEFVILNPFAVSQ
jgi:outer membrane protein OmpA-like peptidoglycan-associated protein